MRPSATPRKPYHDDGSRLAGHIPEPTVKNAVLEYARQLNAPFLLRDIWRPLGLPRTAVNRVLDRLLKAGEVTRRPFEVDYVNTLPTVRGKIGRQSMFLYSLVEGEPDAGIC